jgi:hypothetical protein
MLARGGIFGLLLFAFWLWALYDVVTTPKGTERNLPKVAWGVIVFLFFALGSFAWLVFGRPHPEARAAAGGSSGLRDRLRRHPSDARDDAAHLSDRERRDLERRDYYRRMDEELDRRLEEKRRGDPGLSDEGA